MNKKVDLPKCYYALLGVNFLANLLTGKRTIWPGEGATETSQGRGTISRLILLTNFEIPWYYQNEPKFNSAYSRNNLPKIKDGTYVGKIKDGNSLDSIICDCWKCNMLW